MYVLQRQCPVRGEDCHSSGMLRQQYDTSAVVSARAHGFCSVPYSYGFFLQVDALPTVSTRQNVIQNELTMTPLQCWVHVHICLIFGDYCDKFFLQADSLQTLLPSIG